MVLLGITICFSHMALNTSHQQVDIAGRDVGIALPELQEARDSIIIVKFVDY